MSERLTEIRAEKVIAASPTRVWEVLSDHEGMVHWTNLHKVVRRRPGAPDPNGVGAVRTLYGSSVMEERITVFEPGKRLEYDVIKGAPGHQTHGTITLTPTSDGGTLVWWRVHTRPYVPGTGWLIKAFLGGVLAADLQRIKERLEPDLIAPSLR